jgi:hypothetical protein
VLRLSSGKKWRSFFSVSLTGWMFNSFLSKRQTPLFFLFFNFFEVLNLFVVVFCSFSVLFSKT